MRERQRNPDGTIDFRLGHDEIVLSQRYELLSILNDILLGLWFVVGTMFFFSDDTMRTGTWLFLIGSVQMLVRPLIRLARRTHLERRSGGVPAPESTMAY